MDSVNNIETQDTDAKFMELALQEAMTAAKCGEVPVGAILVSPDGTILATAHNQTETTHDPTAHAEMLCLRAATARHDTWRLIDCTLYVTLEPCPMCAGALLQSRIGSVVYGARNTLLGADGSWISMLPSSESAPRHPFNPDIRIRRGVLEGQCSAVMKDFFKRRREEGSSS